MPKILTRLKINEVSAVDRGAFRVEHEFHTVAGHALRPGDRRVVRARLAEQHRLRERRAFVGLQTLVGNEGDLRPRIAALRFDGGEHAGGAASDDDDAARCHVLNLESR